MANRKRLQLVPTTAAHLPEHIIQHIQSFLNGRDAALTASVSKSWFSSWLTRPSLFFDERLFLNLDQFDAFLQFADRTMSRYVQSRLKIDHFRLFMNVRDLEAISFADDLIIKALSLSVNDVDLEIHPTVSMYALPKQVFECVSLVGLSCYGCKINVSRVMCCGLKSIVLRNVKMSDDVIRELFAGCPLIENVSLTDCDGLLRVNVGGVRNLKRLTVYRQVARPVVLRSPLVEFEERGVGRLSRPVLNGRLDVCVFGRLSYLLLERVKIVSASFQDFSSKFPCLEELTIRYCEGCRKFDISSFSLKYVSLALTKKLKAKFVLPNLRRFVFSGAVIPSVSLVTGAGKWESEIALSCWSSHIGFPWFLDLKNFLIELEMSAICLSTGFFFEKHIDFAGRMGAFPRPLVENLILTTHSSSSASSALLDGLFWCCRPKILTQYLFPNSGNECSKATKRFIQLLCQKLEELVTKFDLLKVNAELFEDSTLEWQPLPWIKLFDPSAILDDSKQIRFKLTWESDPEGAGPSCS